MSHSKHNQAITFNLQRKYEMSGTEPLSYHRTIQVFKLHFCFSFFFVFLWLVNTLEINNRREKKKKKPFHLIQSSPQASSLSFCLVTIRVLLASSWLLNSLDPKFDGNFDPIAWAIILWAVLADVCGLWRGGSKSERWTAHISLPSKSLPRIPLWDKS